jgi:hypothetical protein
MILVDELSEQAGDVLRWSDIQQKVYVVNLEEERLESVATVDLPTRGTLKGVLPGGIFVIMTLNPAPAFRAYRIVTEN